MNDEIQTVLECYMRSGRMSLETVLLSKAQEKTLVESESRKRLSKLRRNSGREDETRPRSFTFGA